MTKCNNVDRRQFVKGTAVTLAGLAAVKVAGEEPEATMPAARTALSGPTGTRNGFGPPIWPPLEKLEALLKRWARQNKSIMTLERLGLSHAGRPVYAVTITDPTADDNDKEHVLVTALHAGVERTGTTTVMAIIEWLLSADPTAREIRRRQTVVCIPLVDPDRYVSGKFSPVYGALQRKGVVNPEALPEAVYLQRVMDRLQPEVHADIHGLALNFARYIMFECSGTAYSNPALRPYHRDIIRQMDAAALAEGFPSDTAESDAERVFYGRGLAAIKSHCWFGEPRFYSAIYAYDRFHTLVSASEIAWERSGLLRHRRLLEIGNERWDGEYYLGYPTRVVAGNSHVRLTAHGKTAAQRRRSRVELWNRLNDFTLGTLDPAVAGKYACVLSTSAAATARFLTDPTLAAILDRLRQHAGINAQSIARLTAGWPAGQNHPKAWIPLLRCGDNSGLTGRNQGTANTRQTPLEHGLCLRLRLPYDRASISTLQLNGHPVPASETDGFVTWAARGSTYIQIGIPPDRLRQEDFFVVTCEYDPYTQRRHWDTWRK